MAGLSKEALATIDRLKEEAGNRLIRLEAKAGEDVDVIVSRQKANDGDWIFEQTIAVGIPKPRECKS